MRVVEVAERLPRKCAVSGNENGPFIDFQQELRPVNPNEPNFLYLRAGIVEEAAKKLGMVPKREVDNLLGQLEGLKGELDELRKDMETYAEFESRFKDRSLPTEALERSAT
jgi:hypothetical protein